MHRTARFVGDPLEQVLGRLVCGLKAVALVGIAGVHVVFIFKGELLLIGSAIALPLALCLSQLRLIAALLQLGAHTALIDVVIVGLLVSRAVHHHIVDVVRMLLLEAPLLLEGALRLLEHDAADAFQHVLVASLEVAAATPVPTRGNCVSAVLRSLVRAFEEVCDRLLRLFLLIEGWIGAPL